MHDGNSSDEQLNESKTSSNPSFSFSILCKRICKTHLGLVRTDWASMGACDFGVIGLAWGCSSFAQNPLPVEQLLLCKIQDLPNYISIPDSWHGSAGQFHCHRQNSSLSGRRSGCPGRFHFRTRITGADCAEPLPLPPPWALAAAEWSATLRSGSHPNLAESTRSTGIPREPRKVRAGIHTEKGEANIEDFTYFSLLMRFFAGLPSAPPQQRVTRGNYHVLLLGETGVPFFWTRGRNPTNRTSSELHSC